MSNRPRTSRLSPTQRRRRYALRRALAIATAVVILAALVLADYAGLFGVAPSGDVETYDGGTYRVTHVVDGDTLDVDVRDTVMGQPTTRIRLWGVDTPETVKENTPVQHFGLEASAFTKASCRGKDARLVLVQGKTRGKYDRLLAYVYLPDGKMLNAELIAQGLGYADPRFDHPRKAEFERLQRDAKAARRGLWKDVTRADLPYYYQKGPHKLDLLLR